MHCLDGPGTLLRLLFLPGFLQLQHCLQSLLHLNRNTWLPTGLGALFLLKWGTHLAGYAYLLRPVLHRALQPSWFAHCSSLVWHAMLCRHDQAVSSTDAPVCPLQLTILLCNAVQA